MTSPDATPGQPTSDTPAGQDSAALHADHVPTPAGGVRGVDQVDRMDPPPAGEGTTTGADGETPAREQQRVDLGERPASADREDDDALEQAAALGETSDPADGSLAGG